MPIQIIIVIALAIALRVLYQARFQRCLSCGKHGLRGDGVYKISCIDPETKVHYPAARMCYQCPSCGAKPAKDFSGKWIAEDLFVPKSNAEPAWHRMWCLRKEQRRSELDL